MIQRLEKQFEALNIMLTNTQEEQFEEYYKILVQWNEVMNLTSITERSEVNTKHFLDSASIVKIMDMNAVNDVIDIGTGAGFPGIPIKILFPHIRITLLDSLNKRVNFLNEVIRCLGLKDISVVHGRAEDFAKRKDYREQFDLCVSRAVAKLFVLSEYCIPYVKENGFFVSYKSGNIDRELSDSLSAIDILGGEIENTTNFLLPDTDIQRSLVKIKKVHLTPKKYPRKAGVPSRQPL